MRILVIMVLAALLPACAPSSEPDRPDVVALPDATPYLRDHFVLHGLEPIGRTRESVRRYLGEPDSVHAEAVRNRHDPSRTDTVVTMFYPALEARIYAVTGGRDMMTGVTVRDNRYLRDTGVRLGQPWEHVRARIGPPEDSADAGYRYDCRACEGAENPVFLHVEDGVLRAARFTYYVD